MSLLNPWSDVTWPAPWLTVLEEAAGAVATAFTVTTRSLDDHRRFTARGRPRARALRR